MANDITLGLADEAATLSLGAHLAHSIKAGQTIYFHGDLGAGKTTFVRGLLHGLGHQGKVKSPTYTLVEPYVISNLNLYHFDLYRFNDPEEWEAAGFRDYFNAESICLIEWPEKARELLPDPDIDIELTPQAGGRQAKLTANTVSGEQTLKALSHG
jgi:tRNA threonylcarbamoyladenosine biosynthesis protein TsaE